MSRPGEPNTEGRVRLVHGDAKEIIPGVTVYTEGAHVASQYVGVNTKLGRMVVASDNVYLYENLDKHVPITATLTPSQTWLARPDEAARGQPSIDHPGTRPGGVRPIAEAGEWCGSNPVAGLRAGIVVYRPDPPFMRVIWAQEEHDFAAAWRSQPKWVVSRTLKSVGPNATLVEDEIDAVIRRLKAQPVGEIEIAGPDLAGSLTVAAFANINGLARTDNAAARSCPISFLCGTSAQAIL